MFAYSVKGTHPPDDSRFQEGGDRSSPHPEPGGFAPSRWEGGNPIRVIFRGRTPAKNDTRKSSPPPGAGLGVGVASDKPNVAIKRHGDTAGKCQIMPFGSIVMGDLVKGVFHFG